MPSRKTRCGAQKRQKAAGAGALRLCRLGGRKNPRGAGAPRFLKGLGDVAGTDAAGADLDGPNRAVIDRLYLLEVWVPGGTGFVVCVADIVPGAGTFTADFAFS